MTRGQKTIALKEHDKGDEGAVENGDEIIYFEPGLSPMKLNNYNFL